MRSVITHGLVFVAICGFATAHAAALASADPSVMNSPDCREPAAVAAPVGAADLRSGVDVHGRPVVPADLNPPPSWATVQPIDLDVRIGVGPRAGDARRLEGTMPLGRLTIEDGEARLDGEPLVADPCRTPPGNAGTYP
jgi:hypothetical protein